MKQYFLLALLVPATLLGGCANPYEFKTCKGHCYKPPFYGTYPDSSYYDQDYYKNYERENMGVGDHRFDRNFGPNEEYTPSERPI